MVQFLVIINTHIGTYNSYIYIMSYALDASRNTSTILITPFHLTISPLFRPVIPLLILNFLSWRAYSFLNLTLPQQKELIRSLCDLALYSRHFIGFPM